MKALLQWLKDFFSLKGGPVVVSPAQEPQPVVIKPPAPTIETTPWMDLANHELGQSEVPGVQDNPRIVEYHSVTTLKATDDETPWCSSFVSWVLEKSGYKSTQDAWARSYLNYGTKLDKPKYGCLVIYDRGAGKGHVHFYVREDAEYIYGIGGNQDNTVKLKAYPKSAVLGYRWPVAKALQPKPTELNSFALSWEKGHPERASWTKVLTDEIAFGGAIDVFAQAEDVEFFVPNFRVLTKREKIKAIAELFVATAYYESAWNPRSQSVDVGTASNKDTWSVGLFQMSVVDQKNYGLSFGFSFDDLITAAPNIKLALSVMKQQIMRKGKIVVDKGPYWAVLYRGKYSKVDEIKARVAKALA